MSSFAWIAVEARPRGGARGIKHDVFDSVAKARFSQGSLLAVQCCIVLISSNNAGITVSTGGKRLHLSTRDAGVHIC